MMPRFTGKGIRIARKLVLLFLIFALLLTTLTDFDPFGVNTTKSDKQSEIASPLKFLPKFFKNDNKCEYLSSLIISLIGIYLNFA